MSRTIQTVLGPIAPEQLGRCLTHEHFSLDFEKFFVPPPKMLEQYLDDKITLGNVGVLKQYPYSSHYNVAFYDDATHDAVLADILAFKQFGGGAVVENTTHGLNRDVKLMKRVSLASGVHVIAGTGHYVSTVQPDSVLAQSQEQLHDLMLTELTVGCVDEPEIKCGIIGEVGSNWPMHEFEKRAVRATAEVQAQTGCPVSFHPGRNAAAPFEIMRLYLEAGGSADKAVMSHLDRTLLKDEDLLRYAELGSYCQFDLFGTECVTYQFSAELDMPSDIQRVQKVVLLLEEGRGDKVLMAHDIHTKHRLLAFGGHGFSHIQNTVLPKLSAKGISDDIIDQLTIINPGMWLAYPNHPAKQA